MTHKNEHGQSTILTLIFLTVLLGMAALVLDVGSWYRAHRAAQSTADASALAGAQALPDVGTATSLATSYADKNGGGVAASSVTFSTERIANDTISVKVTRTAPGFLSKLFGFNSVAVGGRASARSGAVSSVRYVAPITVNYLHPLLHCTRTPQPVCNPQFGVTTTLTLTDLHSPGSGDGSGSFGLINLNQGDNSNIGAGTLANWLVNGYPDYMALGLYYSAPSSNYNNSQFLGALDAVIGKDILFPVYRRIVGPGSNAQYDIIGWVGFVVRSYRATGSDATLTGEFVRYIADGIPSDNGGPPDLGVRDIALVN